MKSLNPVITALAFTLGASGAAGAQPEPVQCDIDILRTPQGIVLRPTARSTTAVSGSYQLSVNTSGPDGQSDVSQGGDFSVRADRAETLGTVALGGPSRGHVTARLDLAWPGGQTRCARQIRL